MATIPPSSLSDDARILTLRTKPGTAQHFAFRALERSIISGTYKNLAEYNNVAEKIAKKYNEDPALFTIPADHALQEKWQPKLTSRQTTLMSALIGMSNQDMGTFFILATTENKPGRNEASLPDVFELRREIKQIIIDAQEAAKPKPVARAISPERLAALLAELEAAADLHNTQPAPPAAEQEIKPDKGKRKDRSPVIRGPLKNGLAGKTGMELLESVKAEGLSFGQVLAKIAGQTNQAHFLQESGINLYLYNTITDNARVHAYDDDTLAKLYKVVGAETSEEQAAWKEFILPQVVYPKNEAGRELKGLELIKYALEKKLTLGGLLEEIRELSNCTKVQFTEKLGLSRMQYKLIVADKLKQPPLELLDKIAENFGATTELERVPWRQFILNIPLGRDQKLLNECFTPGAEHAIDTEMPGYGHSIALAKFFRLLADRHGAQGRSQLAEIMEKQGVIGPLERNELILLLHRMAGPVSNETVEATELDEATLKSDDKRTKNMPKEAAEKLARFAFPENETLRARCMEFLAPKDEKKYFTPPEFTSQKKSAAMTTLRANHPDWGKRIKNESLPEDPSHSL